MNGERQRWVQAEGFWVPRATVILVAVLGALVWSVGAVVPFTVSLGKAEVQIYPEHPTEGDSVVLVVSGTWTNSCVPKLSAVRMSGKHIIVSMESSATGCTGLLAPWKLQATVEGLPPGTYAVTVTHRMAGPGYVLPEKTIGQATFQVRMSGCDSGEPLPEPSVTDLAELVRGNTEFALALYQALRGDGGTEGENLFFSPYNISLCLAMAYAGARGETERQMAEALRFTLPQDRLHPAFARLSLALAGRRGLELSTANSLWGQRGYPFLPSFLCLLGEVYGAPLRELDFWADPEAARQTINRWVEEETRERIQDLIPPGGINPLTRLVLVNAVYFEAAWKFPFDKGATHDAPFYLLDGREILVPTMTEAAGFGYAAGEGWQAVELPYEGEQVSMVILLPDLGRFEEFERSLDAHRLAEIVGQLEATQLSVYLRLSLPKFTFTSRLELARVLAEELGMCDAFSARADFSGMTGRPDLFIDKVYHQAFVEVDEAGTEAAAATAGVVMPMGLMPEPHEVRVNRPFLFLIRDRETGTVLSLGRVLDPAS